MTDEVVEIDDGTGIMIGIMIGTMTEIVTGTGDGGVGVTALITMTGGGDAIVITDITGIVGFAGTNR